MPLLFNIREKCPCVSFFCMFISCDIVKHVLSKSGDFPEYQHYFKCDIILYNNSINKTLLRHNSANIVCFYSISARRVVPHQTTADTQRRIVTEWVCVLNESWISDSVTHSKSRDQFLNDLAISVNSLIEWLNGSLINPIRI